MKAIAVLLPLIMCAGTPALAADRLTDRDVKTLVDRIDQDRDRWENALDDNFKHSVFRSATGEVDVKRGLEDFQKSIEHFKDRLKPDYAASTEAAAMLRQASRVEAFMSQQSNPKGTSEWNTLATDMKALAAAYGASFPLADKAPVRRIGDQELVAAADALARTGEQVRKSLDADLKKDKSVAEQTRKTLLDQAEQWSKDVKTLRDRVKDGQPTSSEAERVLQGATALQAAIDGHQTPAAKKAWAGTTTPRQTVAQAYGMPPQAP